MEDRHDKELELRHQNFPETASEKSKGEFWNSKDGITDKVDILIQINMLTLNILTELLLRSSDSSRIMSKGLENELVLIKDFLNSIESLLKPNFNLVSTLDQLKKKITIITEKTELAIQDGDQKQLSRLNQESSQKKIGYFIYNTYYTDLWGIIESIQSLINSYSRLSHVAFPQYYFEACKEIFRYRAEPDIPKSQVLEIFQIPSSMLQSLIEKLLREAPAARLLQNLKKLYPRGLEGQQISKEKDIIHKIVENYFLRISEYLQGTRELSDSLRVSSGVLRIFNLGSGDLESRIPNVSFNIVKKCYRELQSSNHDELKQYIYSETIILIHRINESVLSDEQFRNYLRQLK
ncbi:MAG: hypothetical protein ACTSW1_03545 [Candidatus Hodarchaeales archaeon]